MMKLAMEAPWYTFRKKVDALFGQDPDIKVGEIHETADGSADYGLDIEVRSHEKFLALDRVLPKVKTFGSIKVGITLFDEENANAQDSTVELYRTLFDGNPIVKDIKERADITGTRHGFVRFRPQVIQFFDDNMADYNGNWTGLAQDIAKEVFETEFRGIHFCTADGKEEDETDEESARD